MDFQNELWILLAIIAASIISFLGIYTKKKLNITNEDIEFVKLILDTVNYIADKFNYTNKEKLNTVVKYIKEAIDFVDKFDTASDELDVKMELILDKTKEILLENNIEFENDLDDIIKEVIHYISKRNIVVNK